MNVRATRFVRLLTLLSRWGLKSKSLQGIFFPQLTPHSSLETSELGEGTHDLFDPKYSLTHSTIKGPRWDGMAFSSSIKTFATSLALLSTLLFFLVFSHSSPPKPSHPLSTSILSRRFLLNNTSFPPPCSSILQIPSQQRCSFSISHCGGDSNGLFNYSSLHFCFFRENSFLSISSLSLIILLQFYILVRTAQDRFSVVVTKLAIHLNLSPSMGAVTLLALGNGAPDVFASVAAVRGGHPRTGLGAILSAGTFVSAFVVGFVAIYAAPFSVDPAPFVRDVLFYLIAALSLFSVYLSAEIFLWQAIGFVGFYVFFVAFVFWMDLRVEARGKDDEAAMVFGEVRKGSTSKVSDCENGEGMGILEEQKTGSGCSETLGKVSRMWEIPVSVLLKLTIPQPELSEWSRFYISANIALCPLAILYTCSSFIPLNHKIVFLLPYNHFPLWSVVLFSSSSLALLHYALEKEPPKAEQMPVIIISFMMSVFWISTVAGELLDCLAAVGTILELPPTLLGLTVLAWGNSVGDLVADVAVARAGQPAMAMAGCFAGPMFNMLVGLGTALVMQTMDIYPTAYELRFHVSIVIAFVFLLLSLMGSLFVVTFFRFRVPRFWGFFLVGLYCLFIMVSLIIAKITG
ncbi:cation/calcium exchanger 5 [Macadamia integrifolia]|uniref:cation/calcium exchanger 5 n=1 Tax=Macadamia integrifolia TaxID=60698 RepID=UPI001C4E9D4F|nr:cation/calcium exchanger 5 [Macadamia integrifolia]